MMLPQAISRRPVVVVAAHPDDETAGAGALLGRLREPRVVHLTDGASQPAGAGREADVRIRRQEVLAALELAGIGADQTCTLHVAEREASLAMAYIALRLLDIFRKLRPAAVLTHPYEGGHPDHDAAAFTVQAACARLPDAPDIFEFACYHAADGDTQAIETGRFLEGAGEPLVLSEADRERKQRMIACFHTQLQRLRRFPLGVEVFRPAPVYDFTEPPHSGKLYYEHFDWGMSGERWRFFAANALRTLEGADED
jgi:LmbE family N-acetylglucosaminyl deacetylase